MLRRLLLRKVDSYEKQLGESLEYMRYILRHSLGAFLKFARAVPFAGYRKRLPAAAAHIARLVAARDEDCGPCVQIVINTALAEGMNADWLQAALDERPERLPLELAEVYRFADEVIRRTGTEGNLREALRQRWGDQGIIELAYAMAGTRIFPVVKRVLGYATSCRISRPHVPGSSVIQD